MTRTTRRRFLRDASLSLAGGASLSGLLAAACRRGEQRHATREAQPVVVIGCGGVGIIAATALLQQGIPVLCLDGGPLNGLEQARNHPPGVPDEPYRATGDGFSWARLRQVGGRLTRWQGHCPRLSPRNFVEGGERAAEFSWPIGYDDLAPYYRRAERILGVTGRAANIPDLPDGEFVASLADRSLDRHLAHVLDPLGARLTPGRFAIYPQAASRSRLGQRPVERDRKLENALDTFNSLPYVYAELLGDERFALVPDATVLRIDAHPESGGVERVTWLDKARGETHELESSAVVLAAGCIESTKILLQSTSARYPDGLGNASGVLGRYLTDHPQTYVRYRFGRDVFEPEIDPGDDLPNPGHHGSFLVCRQDALRQTAPELHGRFAFQIKQLRPSEHAAAFGGICRMDSSPDNRVVLTGEATPSGIPIPEIRFAFGAQDRARVQAMLAASDRLAGMAGGRAVGKPWIGPPGGTIHYTGTCRMGHDPATSMLDAYCESHEVPGLFVVDGSAFVSNPEKNPTLTMMALALRAGERLGRRLARA